MTTNHGRQIAGRTDRQNRVGVGLPVNEMAKDVLRKFDSFRHGLVLADDPESLPDTCTPDALDFQVDDQDRLVRWPGIAQIEDFAPHDPKEIFAHPNLDGAVELVFFDSPDIGVKPITGLPTVWTPAGLPTGEAWAVANHGGDLAFSNGVDDVFYRGFGEAGANPLGWDPAVSLASWAGRLWGLGGSIGGVSNPLGIKWTGASGVITDVGGLGSGAELLLADVAEGDRAVALKPMGFDYMAILMRKSIWIARRTGDPYRPANFEPRLTGTGCVAQATAKNGPQGTIIFLSDSGVEIFDGNSTQHLSGAIDAELLPLSYTQIGQYGAVYSPLRDEYKLFTPGGTYVYSFKHQRWLKSSSVVQRAVVLFNPSLVDVSDLPAGWGLYWDGAWGESATVGNVVLGDIVYLKSSRLGVDDYDLTSFFGAEFVPYWKTPRVDSGDFDALFTTKRVEVFHTADAGQLLLEIHDRDDSYRSYGSAISLVPPLTRTKIDGLRSGRGLGLKITMLGGLPKIRRLSVTGEPRSRETSS